MPYQPKTHCQKKWRKRPPESRESAAARGYNTSWQRRRRAFLRKHPLCVMCKAMGFTKAATVVDHIIPHRGDSKLFNDQSNWQGLCKPHHDREKRIIENRGGGVGEISNS